MMKKPFESRTLLATVCAIGGLLVGWLIFHDSSSSTESEEITDTESSEEAIWTCSMHPQIRQNEPGDCPICGMDLIPLGETNAGPNVVELSHHTVELANIQTSPVNFAAPRKEILLQGKVQLDERKVNNQTAHVAGRIESLFVSFTGEYVRAGQRLATVYSPDLVTAQRELFESIKTMDVNPSLYNAARNKLKQWKLTDDQIDEIEEGGQVLEEVDIKADISGVVLERKVSVGDYVKEGEVLYTIADLSTVWLEFDAYEADIQWLAVGDTVHYTIGSLPGSSFSDKVTFIEPIIDPVTRTTSIRLEVSNKDGDLKPEMFANGKVFASLPIDEPVLIVPKSAVMWTGIRSVVYVAIPDAMTPMFEFREVILGPDLGGYYVIKEGLLEGEQVVTNGTFKVDAAAQLAGVTSMMNRNGETYTEDHDHADMADSEMSNNDEARFAVSGNCGMCKSRIETAATSLEGVQHAEWSAEDQMITVHFNLEEVGLEQIGQTIADAGHDTEYATADASVYGGLPGCCLYSRD